MLSILYKLRWFFRQHWKRYTIAVVLLILVGVGDIIPPQIVGRVVDGIQQGTITYGRLAELLLFTLGLTFIIYGITYVWMYQLFGGAYWVERILRSRLMKHFMRMTPTFYERNRTGDLMARATNDLKAVSITAGFGILTLVDSTAFMIVILCTMGFAISWKLTFAALLPLPFIALAMKVYGKTIHERYTKAQDAFGDMNDQVLESVSGVRVIRAYVQEQEDRNRFRDITEDVYAKNASVARIDALFDPTIKVLVGISYMIGLGYGAYLVFQNSITLGDLVTFNVYLGMLIWPMFALGELINVMQRGSASMDRVNETLGYSEDVSERPHPTYVDSPETIEFEDVTFRYPSSTVDNLKHVSFTLKRGQTLGIVGRTGSGKSTLIKQLMREYPGLKGSIRISGVPIEHLSLEQLHGWIGYVPQEQLLFSKTVRENILFGKSGGSDGDVQKAIQDASFSQDIETLSQGLETLVGEKGVALSGGQKQRVSLSRALIGDPEILILDDAMSAVDARTEARIIENIRRERSGKTTLISSHRLSAVEHADWIIVMEDGRIAEQGTHEDLVALGGWYREQFERQQVESNLSEAEVNA
ncbi:ABC transporter transmembrane domain-containing protein [Paenibacillus larvae]|uniref:ABC transporter transmembrane domain-containing protein n=2 Tax=Paenibacillus larvae TaxID=1464 RepID=A0AAP5JST5_9BACL|nr:ABC transporter transmembrane domain-containing protein [Paenibacillus larvae]AVF24115.1 putative multidrug resistance ABC transporter ATP-binding/permease protein YheI [Paenibacillus larvae subsp. larvae]AVG14247.1 putative multidrug resistance ABC transporter ATP-binding/permease protein YheI [Paenibacillus larvae subsp. larvae DSM 25430]ETK28951.1 putative multidrug resistance ABC transporter ATP-binding/permease protein YheI [Paenibacillus larvae subsp. larvae DSM 25719]MCY7478482.1 ATP-